MTLEARIYQVLVILGTFASALLPAWVAIEIFRTQAPTKSLEVYTSFANPIDSLGSLKDKAKLSLSVGDRTYDNLTVASITISNRGTTAITDADIKSPITATISSQWKIVAVGEFEVAGRAAPKAISWENKDGKSIIATAPFLLNQGESYTFPVYMTKTDVQSKGPQDGTLFWSARIVGLPEIKVTEYSNPTYGGSYAQPGVLDQVIVFLTPRNVFALFAIAFPLAWLYLHLLAAVPMPNETRTLRPALTIGLVFASVAVAEVSQSYLRSSAEYPTYQPSYVEWINGAIVAIGFLLALTLYVRGRLDKTIRGATKPSDG